jgi:tryptophan-rich sensory protein
MSWKWFVIFLVVNFGALGLGGWLQGEGARSDWYQGLQKAPWTPPGWVFGAAWFSIMLLFSVFMARWIAKDGSALVWTLFGIQFVLNVLWNPVFFRWQEMGIALAMIALLFVLTAVMLIVGWRNVGIWSLLMLPYALWLGIATSLNAYALLKN